MNKLVFIFLFLSYISFSQEQKKSKLLPKKIGFLYNHGTENNFLFDDPDYTYHTYTYKLQLFYDLGNWRKLDFELAVQPQVQFLKHQLLNKWFVYDKYGPNYLQLRDLYTQDKSMQLYALELALLMKKQITEKFNFQVGLGAGLAIINTDTERLAKGFTFIENLSFGFNFQYSEKSSIYLGSNLGHVSNFDFQWPNDGYNILGFELGFKYRL